MSTDPISTAASADTTSPPWAGWTERGVWAKSALVLSIVAMGAAVTGRIFNVENASTAFTSLQIQHGAESLGRLTPYVVILSVFAEPVRHRRWSFPAMLIWAVAGVLLALVDLDFFFIFRDLARGE